MFGLFKIPVSNRDLLVSIIWYLIKVRTDFRSVDSQFDVAILELPGYVDKLNKKLTSRQWADINTCKKVCELEADKIRTCVDLILRGIEKPNEGPDLSRHQYTIFHLFKSYDPSWMADVSINSLPFPLGEILGSKKKIAHIENALSGYRCELWSVDQQIDERESKKCDPNNTGQLYAAEIYENGELQKFLIYEKDKWDLFRKQLEQIRRDQMTEEEEE